VQADEIAAFRKKLEAASAAAAAAAAAAEKAKQSKSSRSKPSRADKVKRKQVEQSDNDNDEKGKGQTKGQTKGRSEGKRDSDPDDTDSYVDDDLDEDDEEEDDDDDEGETGYDPLCDPLNGSARSRCMDSLVHLPKVPVARAVAALDATAARVRDRERQRRAAARVLGGGDGGGGGGDDEESDGGGVNEGNESDPRDAKLWVEAAHVWLDDQEEMLDLRDAMEASLREAEAEQERKLEEGADPFDLVGGAGSGSGGGGGGEGSKASAAQPSLLLPRGSVVVKVLQKKMGEFPSSSSASRFEALFTPRAPPRAALARLLGRERDAKKWFGGCPGTGVFLEDLSLRLAKEIAQTKAFAAAASATSPLSSPRGAVAAAAAADSVAGDAAIAERTSAAAELVALLERAIAELSSVLFSMPKVGGGPPDAFVRLVPVNLVDGEDDDEVVVVNGGGGGRGPGGNNNTSSVPPPVVV
jgi:hypothetical protein